MKKHPLHERKNPGRQAHVDVGDATLERASRVLDAIEDGVIEKHYVPTNKSDRAGRPAWWAQFIADYGPIKKRLSANQEAFLADRIQRFGDVDARNLLVSMNFGLVYLMAKPYGGSSDFSDIVEEGRAGILRAAEDFDASRGIKFSTYASNWIFAKIQRFRLNLQREREPAITDGGVLYDGDGPLDSSERRKRRRRAHMRSLDAPVGDEVSDGVETLGDFIAANDEPADESIERRELTERVRRAMAEAVKLDPERMQIIVDKRLFAKEPESLEAIGQMFEVKISREGVRLVENRLLKAFKEHYFGYVPPKRKPGRVRGSKNKT